MNTDVEELLREGMERFTRDLRAPAGLTRRAVRRRRRRWALRSMITVTALAAAAVTLVAVLPDPGHNAIPAVSTGYVVKRVDSALAAAEPGAIAQVKVTITRGKTVQITGEEWSSGDEQRAVMYSPPGRLIDDEGSTSSAFTLVSYLTRTWARQTGLSQLKRPYPGPHGCPPGTAILIPPVFVPGLPGPSLYGQSQSVARNLRTAISCGVLTVAGRQRVDGIDAVKLTSRPGSLVPETVWVNPGTYLPVRLVRSGPGTAQRQTADITWLPPTPQNLAKLTVPVPAGFHRVPVGGALRPVLRQLPVGLSVPMGLVTPGAPPAIPDPGPAHRMTRGRADI